MKLSITRTAIDKNSYQEMAEEEAKIAFVNNLIKNGQCEKKIIDISDTVSSRDRYYVEFRAYTLTKDEISEISSILKRLLWQFRRNIRSHDRPEVKKLINELYSTIFN